MKRRDLLLIPAALGVTAASLRAVHAAAQNDNSTTRTHDAPEPLRVPADGVIPVAFLISEGTVVIDFAGPWEVFQSVRLSGPRASVSSLHSCRDHRPATHCRWLEDRH